MVSMVILAIGLLSVLALLGVSMAATQTSQEDLIARQVASETMESIFNARNTSQIGFAAINSTTATPPGLFLPTPNMPLLCAGPDGILGTADDANCAVTSGTSVGSVPCGGVEFLTDPGADGVLGTADDTYQCLSNFTRTIQINEMAGNATLVQVVITITYTVPNIGHLRTYVLEEYISSYS